nr:hypothetical protein [Tanacetum cinerariifolium]
MSKRMIGNNKEEEEALIDILKTVVEECKSIYKTTPIPSSRTSSIQVVSFVAEEEEERECSETLPCKQHDDSQKDEVGSHFSEDVVSRWHVCKPIHVTFKVCKEYCGIWPTCNLDLSFCSGYDVIYGKEKNGMLKQWVTLKGQGITHTLGTLRKKRYALEEVWEKCKKFHDSAKLWYDKEFEEEEL